MTNNSVPPNSIWPNSGGNLGKMKTQIPDGITSQWPEGDVLVNDFVYKDGKLVGFVDSRALVINDEKTSTIPYEYAKLNLPSIFKGTMTFQSGEKNKTLIDGCEEDAGVFVTPLLKELLGNVEFKAEHIKSENKLVVHTDRLDDEQLAEVEDILKRYVPQFIEVVRYNHHIEIPWRKYFQYDKCVNDADMVAVNPDYLNDLTSDGWWVYPISNLKRLTATFQVKSEQGDSFRRNLTHFVINGSIPYIFSNEGSSDWPAHNHSVFKTFKNLVEFRAKTIGSQRMIEWFRDCNNLRVFRGEMTRIIDGTSLFHGCKLDKESVLHIAATIRNMVGDTDRWRNTVITLGIHVDHKNDEEVLAAIDTITAKDWTVTVQWNGTPTSGIVTTDLDEIYAKVTESEFGEYVDENGNRCHLDWGHAITSPDGKTPAEMGYKLFFSLYDAEQYFKLTKIEVTEND